MGNYENYGKYDVHSLRHRRSPDADAFVQRLIAKREAESQGVQVQRIFLEIEERRTAASGLLLQRLSEVKSGGRAAESILAAHEKNKPVQQQEIPEEPSL